MAAGCATSPPPPLRIIGSTETSAAEPEPKPRWTFRRPTVSRDRTVGRVLLYHSFGWFSDMRPAVSPYAFRTQLDWLESHEIEVVPLGAMLDFLDGTTELPERVAVITIDDGELNGYTVAYPILAERELPFTLAIATEAVERHASRGTIPWDTLRRMSGDSLVTIASHSHSHPNLTALSERRLSDELVRSRELIEEKVGVRPEAFVYPLGAHDERVRAAVATAGYRAAFVARGGPVHADTPKDAIPRYAVEKATSIFEFGHFFRHRR